MTFEIINKRIRGSGPATGVSVGQQYTQRSGFNLVVRLGVDVMEALDISKGDRVEMAWGHGQNAKKLRIRGDLDGFALGYSGLRSKTPIVRIPAPTNTNATTHRMAPTPYEIVDGALYVELPDWARAKPAKAV